MILHCNFLFFKPRHLIVSSCFVQDLSTFVSHNFSFFTNISLPPIMKHLCIMCFINSDIKFSRDKALTFMSSTFTMLVTKFTIKLLYKYHICTGRFVLFIVFIYLCNFISITFIYTSLLLLF
jgi:hypothetical protein